MQLIKLDATASTNNYLKQLARTEVLTDFTVVVANEQTNGRGQRSNLWVSEKGKNLTVSVLKRFNVLQVSQSFGINCAISLAIHDVLFDLSVPVIRVKWPNDIMSGNKKLCGILIENTLKGGLIHQSIIGFGLNINQTNFQNLLKASSLKLETGIDYDLDDILDKILLRLKFYLSALENNDFIKLKKAYEDVLFKKDEVSHFISENGENFNGIIRQVTPEGQLTLEREGGEFENYGFKEIRLVY